MVAIGLVLIHTPIVYALRFEPSLSIGATYTQETLETAAGNTNTEQSRIGFVQALTEWNGPISGWLANGSIGLGLSRSSRTRSDSINLSHSMEYTGNDRLSLRLSLNAGANRSEGLLNLNLSERIDRSRQIDLLNGIAPLTINAENQLVRSSFALTSQMNYRLSRTWDLSIDATRSESRLQDQWRNPNLEQQTDLRSLTGGLNWQINSRLLARLSISQRKTEISNSISAAVVGGPASVLVFQEENEKNAALGWRFSGTSLWEITYLELRTATNELLDSQASGPGLRWSWRPSRRWTMISFVQKLRVKLDERESFSSEYGVFNLRYQINENDQFSLNASKNLDTAQVNFDLLTNNQVALEQRRNSVTQINLNLTRTRSRHQWISDWNYFEFETELRRPAFFEHNLSQQYNWQFATGRLWLSAIEARRIISRDPEAPSSIDLIAAYTGIEQRFQVLRRSQRGGFCRLLIRADRSLDRLADSNLQRYAISLIGGYSF